MAKLAPADAQTSTVATRYWLLSIGRALIAAVAAVVITFSSDHSATVGLTVFGAFAVATGIAMGAWGFHALAADGVAKWTFFVQWVVTALVGGVALVFALTTAALPWLYGTVISWAVITGALELYSGIRARRSAVLAPAARDWMTVGALTILLAVAYLLVPPGMNQQLGGLENIEGQLTASVMIVGLFGAYAAIVAVFLFIGGLSLKWGADPGRAPSTPAGPAS